MWVPRYIQRAIQRRFPGVRLDFCRTRRRWLLVSRLGRGGRRKKLTELRASDGRTALRPNLRNTLGWLVEADTSRLLNQWQRDQFLDRIDQAVTRMQKSKEDEMSDMVRGELAPRLQRALRPHAWGTRGKL